MRITILLIQPFNSDNLTGAAYTIAWISLKNVIDGVHDYKDFLKGQIDFFGWANRLASHSYQTSRRGDKLT